jgi:enoyl-CoA hydratase/carnithine racemase
MPARIERLADPAHVALVTIDRPERANALDPPTLRELATAWRSIAADDAIRCAVLTGAGERIFCSGMDMKTTIPASQRLARGERIDPGDFEGLRDAATAALAGFDLGKPLVCAINGHCRAVGLDMMLASDLRFAVPHATFALEEVARGLYPTGNATVLLPRQIAWVHAMELMLTARPISAVRAAEIGLINAVVEPTELLPRALEAAAAIAANAPLAVRATRAGVRELLAMPLEAAHRRQEEIGRPLRRTEDAAEAARAFAEKRSPVWRGR